MIEGRICANTHELPYTDFDRRVSGVVLKMVDRVPRHSVSPIFRDFPEHICEVVKCVEQILPLRPKKASRIVRKLIILHFELSGGGLPCLHTVIKRCRCPEIPGRGWIKPVEIPFRLP